MFCHVRSEASKDEMRRMGMELNLENAAQSNQNDVLSRYKEDEKDIRQKSRG